MYQALFAVQSIRVAIASQELPRGVFEEVSNHLQT
jgi:hypothetical protein